MAGKALFIELRVIDERCIYAGGCQACIDECPVDIFAAPASGNKTQAGKPIAQIVEANQDECTLCDLCLRDCPTNAVELHKLY